MLRKAFIFLSVIFISHSYSQELPTNFRIGLHPLAKVSDNTPASNSVERILINEKTIWLGTGNGLSKSTDNGNSWTNFYKTQEFGEEGISAVGYSDGTIWAATWHMENQIGSDVPVGTGLRFSSDAGATWKEIPQPVDADGDSTINYGSNKLRALPITVRPGNFIYDIAFTKNKIWIVSYYGGLRSARIDSLISNPNYKWQRVVLPPDNLDSIKPTDILKFDLSPSSGNLGFQNNLNHRAFSILAVDDNTIYVGTAGGINKSTDGGVSWTKFNHTNQSKPISGNFILALEKNDFDNSIWAGTWKAEGQSEFWGVSVSKDGGQNWENFLSGEKIRDFGFKYLGNPGAYTGADVFAASENGLFRTSNNGATWIAAPPIIDDATKIPTNTNKFLSVEPERKDDGTYNIWIGSNGDGLIRLTETTNDFWSGEWEVYLSREKVASVSETYAFPNPFSPDEETTKIVYSTTQPEEVTIRIFDFGMNLVKTLVQNAGRGISDEHIVSWNGRDESGKIVPNGVYFYRIDIASGTPLYGKIMVMM